MILSAIPTMRLPCPTLDLKTILPSSKASGKTTSRLRCSKRWKPRISSDRNDPLRNTNDALAVSNARLENDIAKLEGKRQNNLKIALLEAVEAADKLRSE